MIIGTSNQSVSVDLCMTEAISKPIKKHQTARKILFILKDRQQLLFLGAFSSSCTELNRTFSGCNTFYFGVHSFKATCLGFQMI